MKLKLIAIAAIALSPAVVLGQTRTHIRVTKDGSHASQSTGDVTSTPAPAAEPAPAPAPEPTPAPAATTTTTTTDSSTQLGTGAVAPTPTHSQQTDSAATMSTDSSSMSGMKMDSAATPVDTVRVPRSNLNVSPIDSVKMGIPSTKETEKADSARAAKTP
jgi:hypothetical protein